MLGCSRALYSAAQRWPGGGSDRHGRDCGRRGEDKRHGGLRRDSAGGPLVPPRRKNTGSVGVLHFCRDSCIIVQLQPETLPGRFCLLLRWAMRAFVEMRLQGTAAEEQGSRWQLLSSIPGGRHTSYGDSVSWHSLPSLDVVLCCGRFY